MDELDVNLPFHAENFLQQFQVFFILVKIALVFPFLLIAVAITAIVFFKFIKLTNKNAKRMLLFNCALLWFAVRTHIPRSFVILIVALFVVLSSPFISAASKYLTLPYIIQLSGLLKVCVRKRTETDSKFTSTEEIMEYVSVRSTCKHGSKTTVYTDTSNSVKK